MDQPPVEDLDRRETLEHWSAEQAEHRVLQAADARTGLRFALMMRRRRIAQRFWLIANRVLDRGFDTSINTREPEHEQPERNMYAASDWHVLPRALRYLGVSSQDTFVDFGCGKGRVVHQAAKRPFRRVIGVEISPALAEIARANLAARRHRHRCPNVEIVVSDAADFAVPDDLTIAYFYYPFFGATLETVLRRILESIDRRPRLVRLICVGPIGGIRAQILATGRFQLLKKQRSRLLDTGLSEAVIFESL